MPAVVYGVNPQSTIDLVKARTQALRATGRISDNRKVALVVEGGAMRGVISCAALMALEELGLTDAFDEVYGASAGAINAAYFLAGQAGYATTIYYQKINNTRFLRRFWHRQVVDIDGMFESVIAGERPLRIEKVLASRSRLFITIADAVTGESFLGVAQGDDMPLLTLLKASMAIPLLYNERIAVNGRDCLDGGLINPVPVLDAIEAGCTDVLVLLTRPAGFRESVPSLIERSIFEHRCARGNAQLTEAYCKTYMRANAIRDIALGRQSTEGINIATICPDEADPKIERMTRSSELLKAAAIASAKRTFEVFGYSVQEFIEVLRPFPAIAQEIISSSSTLQLRY